MSVEKNDSLFSISCESLVVQTMSSSSSNLIENMLFISAKKAILQVSPDQWISTRNAGGMLSTLTASGKSNGTKKKPRLKLTTMKQNKLSDLGFNLNS
jgi:hypothetical protein